MHKYTSDSAKLYKQLGIKGTTYEPGFEEAARLLGDLSEKTVLDFGCGTGRTTRFLKELGAEAVIGVDVNPNML